MVVAAACGPADAACAPGNAAELELSRAEHDCSPCAGGCVDLRLLERGTLVVVAVSDDVAYRARCPDRGRLRLLLGASPCASREVAVAPVSRDSPRIGSVHDCDCVPRVLHESLLRAGAVHPLC